MIHGFPLQFKNHSLGEWEETNLPPLVKEAEYRFLRPDRRFYFFRFKGKEWSSEAEVDFNSFLYWMGYHMPPLQHEAFGELANMDVFKQGAEDRKGDIFVAFSGGR